MKVNLPQAVKTPNRNRGIVLLDGGGWSTPRLGHFIPGKEILYPFYGGGGGGWVVPRAGLDGCGKSGPSPGFDPLIVQPVASR